MRAHYSKFTIAEGRWANLSNAVDDQPNAKKPTKFASATPPASGEMSVLELSGVKDMPSEDAVDVTLAGLVVHASGKGPSILHYQFFSGDRATEIQSEDLEPSRIQNIAGKALPLGGPADKIKLKIWAQFPAGEVVGVTCPRVMVTFAGPGDDSDEPKEKHSPALPVPSVSVCQKQKSPVEIDTGAVRVEWSVEWDDAENPLSFEIIRRVGVDGVWLRNGKTDKPFQRDPVFEQVPISYRVRSVLGDIVGEWSEEATIEGHLIQQPYGESQ